MNKNVNFLTCFVNKVIVPDITRKQNTKKLHLLDAAFIRNKEKGIILLLLSRALILTIQLSEVSQYQLEF